MIAGSGMAAACSGSGFGGEARTQQMVERSHRRQHDLSVAAGEATDLVPMPEKVAGEQPEI